MDYTALASEINNDPASLGYAALKASGSDVGIVRMMNVAGTGRVGRGVVTTETFMADFGAQVLAILSDITLSDQQHFAPLLKMLGIVKTVDYGYGIVQSALHNMIGIAGLTQAAIDSTTTRPASRAEILFGAGVSVAVNDVSFALRGY